MSRRFRLVSILTRVVVSVALLAAALGAYRVLVVTRPLPSRIQARQDLPLVPVMVVHPVPLQRQWRGFGSARPLDSADVPARVTATAIDVPDELRAGAAVEAGQLLVKLDPSDFARQVEIAEQALARIQVDLKQLALEERFLAQRIELDEENVKIAASELERVRALVERGAGTPQDVDRARQAMNQASTARLTSTERMEQLELRRQGLQAQQAAQESTLKRARQDLERTTIRAPIGGRLVSVDVKEGESVAAGQRVARVVGLARVEVPLKLPAAARPTVRTGDIAVLQATDSGGQSWRAPVVRIDPVDDEATRTFAVYVVLDATASAAAPPAPGQFVEGVVWAGPVEPHWLVPRRALQANRLLLIEGGRMASREVRVDFPVERRFPELGLPDDQWVVLETALTAGDMVVLNPARSLVEGQSVQPVPAVPARAQAPGPEDAS